MRCARRSHERACPPRAPILTAPLPRPLGWRRWSASLRRPVSPLTPSLCAGRSDYVFGDFPAEQRPPSAAPSACGAARARVVACARARRGRVSARGSGVGVRRVGGPRRRSRSGSLRARAGACGSVRALRAAAVSRSRACKPRRTADLGVGRVHLRLVCVPVSRKGTVGTCSLSTLQRYGLCLSGVWPPWVDLMGR